MKKFYGGILGDGYWYEVPDVFEVVELVGKEVKVVCECDTHENATRIAVSLNHMYQYSDDSVFQSRVKED